MDDFEIDFICKNYGKVHSRGKLKLAYPFVLEYGSSIPQKLYLEFPSGEIWFGKYVKDSEYIEGLENMISFYGVRPYHMVVFHYSRGSYFKLHVFNECGVEICYPFSCLSSPNLRIRRNDPFLQVGSMNLTDIEIDKLAATFSFNAIWNFAGLHDIVIEKSHLTPNSNFEVMSFTELKKLGMDEGLNSMEFSFARYCWTIRLMRKNGKLLFDRGWYEFVKAANICEGDVCVVYKTVAVSRFKIGVLSKNLLTQWSSTPDNRIVHQRLSWLKILKDSGLQTGKVEMPRLFAMRLGRELGREINFNIANGRVFRGKYNFSKNQISGLKDMISAYDIYHDCVLVFEYVGNSTFHVSTFDSQDMDHLKEITGEFIADIVAELQMNDSQIANENEEGTEVGDENLAMHEEDQENNVLLIDEGNDQFEDEENGNDADQIGNGHDEIILAAEQMNNFVVKLKKSHFDGKGRGVYCSTQFYDLYKDWNSTTILSLNYGGERFEVGVQRKNRSCRFGRGWDDFLRKTKLWQGEILQFRFIHPHTMDVSKIN